jgi:hypothetical protein
MAIINSYPTATPVGSDLIIGTDVSTTPNSTKTFTIDSINELATGTPASGTSNTIPIFTSAVAVGDSTIVRSGTGPASLYTFGGGTAINNISITTTSLTVSGAAALGTLTMTGDIVLPDNAKLEIGSATGGDLQIYHDGSNSYIDEQGTGNLNIKGSTSVLISTASGGQLAQFTDSGSAFLYHSGSLKFSTTANGVTISGQATVPTTPVAATDAASKAYVDGIVGYTTYVARVTQASTAAPVATIIANDTGLTFTWARTGTGVFTVTPSSSFVINKTWIQMTGGDVSTGATTVTVKDISTSFATAVNSNLINGAAADGITAAFVEIRIYP